MGTKYDRLLRRLETEAACKDRGMKIRVRVVPENEPSAPPGYDPVTGVTRVVIGGAYHREAI